MHGHIMADLTQRLADQRGGRGGESLTVHEGHRLDGHADGVGRISIGTQTGDGLGKDDNAETHGQLFDHGRQTDTGDVGYDVHIQLEGALGELEAGILVLLADGTDGHDQRNGLTHNGGQRCADDFQTGETEFTVDVPELPTETVTDCVNADCVDVAKSMLDEGLNVCILNLASRTSPGGGAHKGASAQEESICHQSTLTQSLYQFGSPKYKHIREAGLELVEGVYPMDINFGGVYSPCVTFFRHNADSYYALRDETFDCPIITVASLSNRDKNSINAIAQNKNESTIRRGNATLERVCIIRM